MQNIIAIKILLREKVERRKNLAQEFRFIEDITMTQWRQNRNNMNKVIKILLPLKTITQNCRQRNNSVNPNMYSGDRESY